MYRNAAPKFIHPCRKDTDGKLRYKNGAIEEGSWLVIGKEGERDGVALWDEKGKRIIHTPEEAEFLRVKLRVTKERWDTMKLTGWAKTKTLAYFYDGAKWKYADAGDTVFGYVLAKRLEIEAGGGVVRQDQSSR